MQATSATKMPVVSSAKLLQRLKDNLDFVRNTRLKFRRQKIELFTNTYMYCEQKATEDSKLVVQDVFRELSSSLGGSAACWRNRYTTGKFIKAQRIDIDAANPSGLAAASRWPLKDDDAKKVAHLVNTKAGGKVVMAWLRDRGYAPMQTVPDWRKKEVRVHKKTWADWKPDLQKMLDGMAMTTDGTQTLTLIFKVGSKEALSVTNKR